VVVVAVGVGVGVGVVMNTPKKFKPGPAKTGGGDRVRRKKI